MQKQTKPNLLGAPMAKLVLVVVIIVSLGTVLGVAGWVVKNKPKTTLPVTPPSQELPITISGKLLEPMKISWLFPIETSQKLPFGIIPKLVPNPEGGITQEVLMSFVDKEIEIEGRIISKEIGITGADCEESQIGCLRKIKVILPKNIRIIEKENREVTIATDKTEYEQGEIAKITIKNNLDKEINHNYGGCGSFPFKVQKSMAGKWEYLNTFWGACEIVKNYKIEPNKSQVYEWNQEEYDDFNYGNSFKQVLGGRYRIG